MLPNFNYQNFYLRKKEYEVNIKSNLQQIKTNLKRFKHYHHCGVPLYYMNI